MQLNNLISVCAIVGLVTGCSAPSSTSDPVQQRGFFEYGNFCGPSHPSLKGLTTRSQARKFLRSKRPLDFIDAACKGHDICYTYKGRFSHECDSALQLVLVSVGWKFPDGVCDSVREFIAFAMHNSPSKTNALPFPDIQSRGKPNDPDASDLLTELPSAVLTFPVSVLGQITSGRPVLPSQAERRHDCNPQSGRSIRYLRIALTEPELAASFRDVLNWSRF